MTRHLVLKLTNNICSDLTESHAYYGVFCPASSGDQRVRKSVYLFFEIIQPFKKMHCFNDVIDLKFLNFSGLEVFGIRLTLKFITPDDFISLCFWKVGSEFLIYYQFLILFASLIGIFVPSIPLGRAFLVLNFNF